MTAAPARPIPAGRDIVIGSGNSRRNERRELVEGQQLSLLFDALPDSEYAPAWPATVHAPYNLPHVISGGKPVATTTLGMRQQRACDPPPWIASGDDDALQGGPNITRASSGQHAAPGRLHPHRCAPPPACLTDGRPLATLRVRAALVGFTLRTITEADGLCAYLLSRWGLSRTLPDLAAVAAFLRQVGAPE